MAASIKKNFIYSLLNKAFAVFIPLLVTPYLSRVLGPDGNGVCSFVNSVASYFILFANVGIETYGQREIAMHRDDKEYIKRFIIEITLLRAILTLAALAVYYGLFVFRTGAQNNILYAIYGITVFATAIDFTWFFQGVEDFRLLAVTSICVRVAYIVLTFVFVKTQADLALSAFLTVMTTSAPMVLCAPFILRYAGVKCEKRINPFRHFKECLVYFIPTIAIQIYTILDKTMIGLITGSDFENGYYEQADKLIKLPLTIIMSFNIIIRSRISYYCSTGEEEKIKSLTEKSANLSLMLTMPMAFGMAAVARSLVPVYLGEGYDKCIALIYILSPIIVVICVSNLLATHYFTPYGKQKISNRFLICGAIVNVALNSFLIYFLQSVGAAIASVAAELTVTALYVAFSQKFLPLKNLLKIAYKYMIAAAVMFVPVFFMTAYLPVNVWYLLLEVGVGVAVYAAMLLILRVGFVKDCLRYCKNALHKRKG